MNKKDSFLPKELTVYVLIEEGGIKAARSIANGNRKNGRAKGNGMMLANATVHTWTLFQLTL